MWHSIARRIKSKVSNRRRVSISDKDIQYCAFVVAKSKEVRREKDGEKTWFVEK